MKPERVLMIAAIAFVVLFVSLPLTVFLNQKGVAINA